MNPHGVVMSPVYFQGKAAPTQEAPDLKNLKKNPGKLKGIRKLVAVRPVVDHPQLLSTSRHITQRLIDMIEETWDPAAKTLSGKSRVVVGDPCEMRIALPVGGT